LVTVDVKYIGDDLHISVWDEDPGKDDLIAEATIKLSGMCTNGGIDEWYLLQHKGRDAGHLHLRTIWHPDGRPLEVIVPGLAKPVLITTEGHPA
jgi:Ca2+-dependent lipid-binding protein